MKRIYLFIVLSFHTYTISQAQVVCDKFEIVWKIKNNTLELSIDTDLPDNTDLRVGVGRSYWETGNSSRYAVDYFNKGSKVGEWRNTVKISIKEKLWRNNLRDKQSKMAALGIGFDVAKISDDIKIRLVVPINQADEIFGRGNSKLIGKMVNTSGVRIVEDEVIINLPLGKKISAKSPFVNIDPLLLQKRTTYIVSKRIPLMPELHPKDPVAALEKIKYIDNGGTIKVLQLTLKGETPWYKVKAANSQGKKIGKGWVNSTSLIGQKLKVK